MTTATIDRLSEVQERVLEFVESVQEPIVSTVKNVVEFVDERLPELPELPYAKDIPTTREFLTNQFSFADQMLKQNKKFSLAVSDATKPLEVQLHRTPKAPAPKATASKAKKTTTKAKKTTKAA
jgi:hypothetical protein